MNSSKDKQLAIELMQVLNFYKFHFSLDNPNSKIICPFHGDINPSLSVNITTGKWFCFGCGLTGDARTFVSLMEKKYNKASDLQAAIKFEKIMRSSNKSDFDLSLLPKATRTKDSKHLLDVAHDYYYGLQSIKWEKVTDPDTIQIRNYMQSRGFEPKTLTLAKCKATFNSHYPLIFPMIDNGEFKGWVSRTTLPAIEAKRKYLYNEGFSRANTVVGKYNKHARYVMVVEGYMDRLKLLQLGQRNVIAILGWKMSSQQIEKLKQAGVTRVISALDNDDCGHKGTEYLKQFFKVTRFQFLRDIKDPGDFTSNDYKKMLYRTLGLFNKNERG